MYYFDETALNHAKKCERLAAFRAIWRAFGVFPTRAVRMLFSDRALRDAFALAVRGAKVDKVSTQ